jgi:hypothetical protein
MAFPGVAKTTSAPPLSPSCGRTRKPRCLCQNLPRQHRRQRRCGTGRRRQKRLRHLRLRRLHLRLGTPLRPRRLRLPAEPPGASGNRTRPAPSALRHHLQLRRAPSAAEQPTATSPSSPSRSRRSSKRRRTIPVAVFDRQAAVAQPAPAGLSGRGGRGRWAGVGIRRKALDLTDNSFGRRACHARLRRPFCASAIALSRARCKQFPLRWSSL